MKKWLSLMLAVVLLFTCFTGCNKDEQNENGNNPGDKKNAGLEATVATVNDAIIKRGEVEEMLYAQLGYYISFLDETTLSGYREQILDILIQQEVARQKAVALGYDKLTKEELAEVEKSYKDFYDNGIQHFTTTLKEQDAEDGVFEEVIEQTDYSARAKAELETYLKENYYYTIEKFQGETLLEKYKNYIKDSYIVSNKLLPGVTADVTVPEEDIKKEYDTLLKAQKESYDKDVTAYEKDVASNIESQYYYKENAVNIVYAPEGLRYVKHILIMFPEETKTSIGTVESTMSEAEYYFQSAESALEDAKKALDEAADDAAKTEAQTKLDAAQKDYDTKKKTYDDAKKAYDDALTAAAEEAEMKKKVDDVYAKVQAGEDFDALIKEYGEDTGMENELYKNGYLLSAKTTTYYQIFTDTGMSLENVGDYSKPVYSTYGAHIIQYTSAVTAGEIPYEDVKADIEKTLLADAQNVKFTELLTEWEKDGVKITQYTDALNATIETEEETPEATATAATK